MRVKGYNRSQAFSLNSRISYDALVLLKGVRVIQEYPNRFRDLRRELANLLAMLEDRESARDVVVYYAEDPVVLANPFSLDDIARQGFSMNQSRWRFQKRQMAKRNSARAWLNTLNHQG